MSIQQDEGSDIEAGFESDQQVQEGSRPRQLRPEHSSSTMHRGSAGPTHSRMLNGRSGELQLTPSHSEHMSKSAAQSRFPYASWLSLNCNIKPLAVDTSPIGSHPDSGKQTSCVATSVMATTTVSAC